MSNTATLIRILPWAAVGAMVAFGFMPQTRTAPKVEKEWVLLVSGNTDGYLSPCGCTQPMSGGIKRRATMLKQLTVPGRTVVLETGHFTSGTSPQDRFKAEAMADAVAAWKVDGVAFTAAEMKWSPEQQLVLRELAGNRVLDKVRPVGPFRVSNSDASGNVVILDVGRSEAEQFVRTHPGRSLVIYRQQGRPDASAVKIGKTWLVSPGEKGKFVLRLTYRGGEFRSYQTFDLGPEVKDDPITSAIFRRYQRRVSDSNLLEAVPRSPSAAFSGNEKCGSCHAEALASWHASKHSHALKTLEDDGHGRDPECVSCHTVGLERVGGYRSRLETPNLTDVGCESCHGAGAAHSANPFTEKMSKIGEQSCLSCHTRNNSPNFKFLTYWEKIRHGMGKTGG